VLLETRL